MWSLFYVFNSCINELQLLREWSLRNTAKSEGASFSYWIDRSSWWEQPISHWLVPVKTRKFWLGVCVRCEWQGCRNKQVTVCRKTVFQKLSLRSCVGYLAKLLLALNLKCKMYFSSGALWSSCFRPATTIELTEMLSPCFGWAWKCNQMWDLVVQRKHWVWSCVCILTPSKTLSTGAK